MSHNDADQRYGSEPWKSPHPDSVPVGCIIVILMIATAIFGGGWLLWISLSYQETTTRTIPTAPGNFSDAGLGVNQACNFDCSNLAAATVSPTEITSSGDGEWSLTYSISNTAEPRSDGQGDGFFISEFDVYQTSGGGIGEYVASESTCPSSDPVPVRAGETLTCTAIIKLTGTDSSGFWSGTTFDGSAVLLYASPTGEQSTSIALPGPRIARASN